MAKKCIQWLYRQLPQLITSGVLSQETAQKLHQHYGEVKTTDKKWFMIILYSIIGTLLIGLGIIMLFAYNWEQLSRPARAVLSFLPLIAGQILAAYVLCKKPESDALRESTATFLSLMVGASIALIGQTYNIPGDNAWFTLSWMLLILPLVYLMQASIPALIYIIGITTWAGLLWYEPTESILAWPLVTLVIPHFIWALRQDTYRTRTALLSLGIVAYVLFGTSFSLGKTWSNSWVIIYPCIFSIFYFLGNTRFKGERTRAGVPFRFFGTWGLIILSFMYTYMDHWKSIGKNVLLNDNKHISFLQILPDHILTLTIIVTAIALAYIHRKSKDYLKLLFFSMPLCAILSYFLSEQGTLIPVLLFNAYLLVLSVSHIIFGIKNNAMGIINRGMAILAILIVLRFFDSELSLLFKGLSFVLIGIGFLASNLALTRRKGGAA